MQLYTQIQHGVSSVRIIFYCQYTFTNIKSIGYILLYRPNVHRPIIYKSCNIFHETPYHFKLASDQGQRFKGSGVHDPFVNDHFEQYWTPGLVNLEPLTLQVNTNPGCDSQILLSHDQFDIYAFSLPKEAISATVTDLFFDKVACIVTSSVNLKCYPSHRNQPIAVSYISLLMKIFNDCFLPA